MMISGVLLLIIPTGLIVGDLFFAFNSFNEENVKISFKEFTATINEDYSVDFYVSLNITIRTIGILPRSIVVVMIACESDTIPLARHTSHQIYSIPGNHYTLYHKELSYKSLTDIIFREDIATSETASHLSSGGNITFYLENFITLKWMGRHLSQISGPVQTVTIP